MNDLFIGGAGYGGAIFLGGLEYLDQKKLLDLKNAYGTSIGSLIISAYCLGVKPRQMFDFIKDTGFNFIKYDIKNIKDYHIIEDNALDKFINIIDINEDNSDITLSKFKVKTGININIYATDITNNSYKCFNNFTDGHIKLKTVLKASMSIPFLFKPVEIDNILYVDGAIKNTYGSPPSDIYICGYSFVINSYDSKNFISQFMSAALYSSKPRSTFLIEYKQLKGSETYLKLDKIDVNFLTLMFKNGLEECKKQLI